MAFLFSGGNLDIHDPDMWRRLLAKELPDLEFRLWPEEVGDPSEITFALIHRPTPGLFNSFPNLKGIFSVGAGVENILSDPDLPARVPVIRLVTRAMTERMCEFVIYWVLHFHRQFDSFREQERQKRWRKIRSPEAGARTVGIMGPGELGMAAAHKLAWLGFDVALWGRRPRLLEDMAAFHGEDGLRPFLARSQILVCLLPETPATHDLIDSGVLARLPPGACVVNLARGAILVEKDLLAAVEAGHIAGAALDAFRTEPLPENHPFWSHPRIHVTPHAAGWNTVERSVALVADSIRTILAGGTPRLVADTSAWG